MTETAFTLANNANVNCVTVNVECSWSQLNTSISLGLIINLYVFLSGSSA
jgi:hypothetical protein